MSADVFAGVLFDQRIEHARDHAEDAAVDAIAHDACLGRDRIAGDRAIDPGHHRNVLQRIDRIQEVMEGQLIGGLGFARRYCDAGLAYL